MSPIPLGITLALAAMLLFAICVIFTSIAARKLNTDAGALLATSASVPMGLAMLGAQLWISGPLRQPSWVGIVAFVAAGIFSTYLGRWLFFKAVEMLGPTRASGFQSASPLITAVLGWLLLGEHFGGIALAGMVLGILGLSAMSRRAPRRDAAAPPGAPASAKTTVLATRAVLVVGVGSAAAYAVSHILRAAAVRAWNEPLAGATLGAVAGLLVLLFTSRHQLRPVATRITQNPGSARLYCAIGAMQLAAQALMIASMRYIPASFAALISMCSPLVVLPVSYFVLRANEGITRITVAGMLLTIAGVALLSVQ